MISYGNLWDHLVIKQMTPSIKFDNIIDITLFEKLGDGLLYMSIIFKVSA